MAAVAILQADESDDQMHRSVLPRILHLPRSAFMTLFVAARPRRRTAEGRLSTCT